MESPPRNTKVPEDFETTTQAEVSVGESSEAQDRPDRVQFEFVNLISDNIARSHAMKMYWRQKKSARDRREKNWSENQRPFRPLLPARDPEVQPSVSEGPEAQKVPLGECTNRAEFTQDTSSMGLSDQLWEGLQFPFSNILFREKNSFLYQVTAEHRKLFYHCQCCHSFILRGYRANTNISPLFI
jgi:hypothetical protein